MAEEGQGSYFFPGSVAICINYAFVSRAHGQAETVSGKWLRVEQGRLEQRRRWHHPETKSLRPAPCLSNIAQHQLCVAKQDRKQDRKVINTKQPHNAANSPPSKKSWTETLAVNLGLWGARGRVYRSLSCPTFLFSFKCWRALDPMALWQRAQGHTGVLALPPLCLSLIKGSVSWFAVCWKTAKVQFLRSTD